MSLVEVSELRNLLKFDPSLDAELQHHIDVTVEILENKTKRLWALRTNFVVTLRQEGEFESILQIPLYPITALALVRWNKGETPPVDFSAPMAVDTDYIFFSDTGEVELLGTPHDFYRAQVTGGYDETTVPAQVKEAIRLQIAYAAVRENPENIVSVSKTVDGATASMRNTLYHPRFLSLLKGFRNA